MTWKIKNAETGEVIDLVEDVCHQHPAWVHSQMETADETKLQEAMDNYHPADMVGKGPDCCGVFWDSQAVTWQSPSGSMLDICPGCECFLKRLSVWPKDGRGQEYCTVEHGLHGGVCDFCGSLDGHDAGYRFAAALVRHGVELRKADDRSTSFWRGYNSYVSDPPVCLVHDNGDCYCADCLNYRDLNPDNAITGDDIQTDPDVIRYCSACGEKIAGDLLGT